MHTTFTADHLKTVERVYEMTNSPGIGPIKTVRCKETVHLFDPPDRDEFIRSCRPFGAKWNDTRPDFQRVGLEYERGFDLLFRTAVFPNGIPVGKVMVRKWKNSEETDELIIVESRYDVSPAVLDKLKTLADGRRVVSSDERAAILNESERTRVNPVASEERLARAIGVAIRQGMEGDVPTSAQDRMAKARAAKKAKREPVAVTDAVEGE